MITFVSGNIMDSRAFALVNTVNTFGVMGKGIALQFKNEFPHNFTVYREVCHKRNLTIGQLLIVEDKSLLMSERLIINFPTKTHWRLPSEYSYIERGLKALKQTIVERQIQTMALPALGCGNGGLDWTIVKQMILDTLADVKAEIEVFEPAG